MASRTSNLLRGIATLFGVQIPQRRYYTFMASVKLPRDASWESLWQAIPSPLVEGRLYVALHDSNNPKTGRHIFACQHTFDHAAKTNQTCWPWAQTIVTLRLPRPIHGRWCCLPLAFAFYLHREPLRAGCVRLRGKALRFADKLTQAQGLIERLAQCFAHAPLLVVCDSWFGNNGLFKPPLAHLGERVHVPSRPRMNAALYALPTPTPGKAGRPAKYGARLGNPAYLAERMHSQAKTYTLHVFGARREVLAAEQVVVLKALRCPLRLVRVYRKTQSVALMSTDLTLDVAQIVDYESARWKIEAGFREIKQEIGSFDTEARNRDAVNNHQNFCIAATTITWIYAAHLKQAPLRRSASDNTTEYAFAGVHRAIAQEIARECSAIDCHEPGKPDTKWLISAIMRLVV